MEHLIEYMERVQTHLGWFTVGFVRVKTLSEDDQLLGTGTLVSFMGKHAILTAAHVVEEFRDMEVVGLCLESQAHRLTIPRSHVKTISIGWSGRTTQFGPDLALVQLPDTCVAELHARKSFYELSHMITGGDVEPVNYDAGVFFAAFVGEWTRRGPAEAGFGGTNQFGMLCGGVGRIDRYWESDDYDFCSFTG